MEKRGKNPFIFEEVIKDIKSVKIQGAENIAKSAIKAFLITPTKDSAKRLIATRETEPMMQNSLKILLKSKYPELKSKELLEYIEYAHKEVVKYGASLIKEDMNVYSHCHSSTIIDIFKYAKYKLHKKFVVYTTEVEPLLQGRKTAEDLSKSRIKVIISPDLTAETMLSKCDLFLFGADAFTKKYVVNKIGTNMLVNHSKFLDIPRYACGISLKYTKKINIESRDPKELWNKHNPKITIENPAFDKAPLKDLSGIISEYGILSASSFVKLSKQTVKNLIKT